MRFRFALVLLVCLLVHECSLGGELAAEASAPKHVRIGAALCLTGSLSSVGLAVQNGLQLGAKESNLSNPIKIDLIIEDTRGEAKDSVSIVRKFIDILGVKIIVGPVRSTNVLAVAPIAEQNRVILFTPTASTVEITDAGDFIFRNRERGDGQGIALAELFVRRGIKAAALLAAESGNSISYADAFSKRFAELGGRVVYEAAYQAERQDFRAEIARARHASPQAFFLAAATGTDGAIVVKQIRESGHKELIAGTSGLALSEFLEGAGLQAEGVIFIAPDFDKDDLRVRSYLARYRKRFGIESDIWAANGYDAVRLLAAAVNSCKGARPECVRDYLYAVKDYPGISGRTSFDKNGDVTKPVRLFTIRAGEAVPTEW